MKRERRKPTRAEWREISTPGLVVRKVLDRPQSTRPENTKQAKESREA